MGPVAERNEAELELWIPSEAANFLTSRGNLNLSMKTMFRGVLYHKCNRILGYLNCLRKHKLFSLVIPFSFN